MAWVQKQLKKLGSLKKKTVKLSRAVAYFLRKFPSYTLDDLMEEYASRFYVMLEQSLRLDAQERLEEIQVLSLPNFKFDTDRKRLIDAYRKQSMEPEDRLIDPEDINRNSERFLMAFGYKGRKRK